MPDIEDITGILKTGIRFGAAARIHPKQIEHAVGRLLSVGEVNWKHLEHLGRQLAGDPMFFCEVDIERLNQVLEHTELVGATHRRK